MKKLFVSLSLMLSLLSTNVGQTSDSVIINGHFTGYEVNENNYFIKAIINDLIHGDQVILPMNIDDLGKFHFKIWLDEPQTFYLLFEDGLINLFAKPGDSIFVHAPAKVFSNAFYNGVAEDSIKISGTESLVNKLLQIFNSETDSLFRVSYKIDQINLEIEDPYLFKHENNKQFAMRRQLVADFINKYKISNPTFIEIVNDMVRFNNANNLLLYWLSAHKGVTSDRRIFWEDFVEDIYFEKPKYCRTQSFYYCLRHTFMYDRDYFFSTEPIKSKRVARDSTFVPIFLDSVVANYGSYAQDFILTHIFAKSSKSARSINLYEPHLPFFFQHVNNEYCREYIKEIYDYGKNLPDLKIDLKKLRAQQLPNSVKQVLPNLLARYPGKVIWLDFWATWCAPCIDEMKNEYPELTAHFKSDDVVFIFITNPSSPEKAWHKIIDKLHFEAEHYRLTGNQYATMQQLFHFSSIPHNVLINRQGEIVQQKIIDINNYGREAIEKLLQ